MADPDKEVGIWEIFGFPDVKPSNLNHYLIVFYILVCP